MRNKILRKILGANKISKSPEFLKGKNDLPSINEFTTFHLNELERGRDMKGHSTSDPETISLARNVFKFGNKSKYASFFEDKVLSQPLYSTSELGSIKVKISDIRDSSKYFRNYEANQNKDVLICIGGPAAEDQVVMSTIIPSIKDRLKDIIYTTRDYKESNVNHSAKQSHARHGNALNADETLTGHSLLPVLIKRKILGIELDEVLDSDYKKIDVKFTLNPKTLNIYFQNELNWLKQEYKRQNGEITEHDIGRLESILSQEIMNIVEKEGNIEISGGAERSLKNSSSIHVTFTEKNSKDMEHENESFKRVGIDAKKLSQEEINYLFESDKIQSAWKYPGDTHMKFDIHEINREFAQKNGATWIDGIEIERIMLIKGSDGNSKIAGAMTKDGKYFYANKLHFTGGYKVEFEYEKEAPTRFLSGSRIRNFVNYIEDSIGIENPLTSTITTATGVSINAIFKKSDRMSRIIEKYGSTGEIAITNSHWTMIAHDENHVVIRVTGGGNTGSEEYNPSYFLNTIANTRRIFGDDLIGIVSTYGCPRAINARNSTEFDKIAEGGIISYGKGGTGNTKRHAEAAIGLMMLGFEDETIEYFNKFQSRDNKPLGDDLKEIYEHIKNVEFLHDNVQKTNRRMGYDKSLSFEEMAFVGLALVASSYAIYKATTRNGNEDSEKPSSVTQLNSATKVQTEIVNQRVN